MRIELYRDPAKSPSGKIEDDFSPYLDTFLLPGACSPLGAVLILPGGGYHHRAYHEGDPVAMKFNALGFHAFVLQYRVHPYNYPAPQQDAIRAIKIIRSHAAEWKLDPDKIAIGGFSAGGHLAACAGMMADKYDLPQGDDADNFSGQPNAMLLCYAVLSVKRTYTDAGRPPRTGSPYCDENGKELEFHELVNENTIPAYVWHSADDPVVPSWCSLKFAEAMAAKKRTCNFQLFPHAPHGRGLGYSHRDIENWAKEAAQFLQLWCDFPASSL